MGVVLSHGLHDEDGLLALSFFLHVWGVAGHGDVLGTDTLHKHEGGFEPFKGFAGRPIDTMNRIRGWKLHSAKLGGLGWRWGCLLGIFVLENLDDGLVLDLSHVQVDDGVLHEELHIRKFVKGFVE